MAYFICEQCGSAFRRDRSGDRPIRFCSIACYHTFRKATGYNMACCFKAGLRPWNRGRKGLHTSPETEFKPGCKSLRKLPIGTVTVRTDHQGRSRRFIKVADPNVWILHAVYVYENEHGRIPAGCVIHHRDRDSMNDDIYNLEALTRAEHLDEHREEHLRVKRAKRS